MLWADLGSRLEGGVGLGESLSESFLLAVDIISL